MMKCIQLCPRPECVGGLLQPVSNSHPKHPWASGFFCSKCPRTVYQCTECPSTKFKGNGFFLTEQRLRCHGYRNHRPIKVSNQTDSISHEVDDADFACGASVSTHHTENSVPVVVPEPMDVHKQLKKIFPETNTHTFFTKLVSKGIYPAVRDVVIRASYNTADVHYITVQNVQDEDIHLFLTIAKLLTVIGSASRRYLAESYVGLCRRARVDTSIPLPITLEDFRSQVLNTSNKNSLASLLPRPSIQQLPNRHALASLSQLIATALMICTNHAIPEKAYRIAASKKVTSRYKQSPAATHNRCLYVCINLWFDDWDHTKGLTKANKTAVWTGVASLIIFSNPKDVLCTYSDVFATGPSKLDDVKMGHYELLPLMCHEILNMKESRDETQYYSSRLRKWVNIFPEVGYVMCDQPAKRSMSGMLEGNSNNHSCFGYSLQPKKMQKNFPACAVCFGKMERKCLLPGNCPSCYAWSLPNGGSRDILYTDGTRPFQIKFPALKIVWKESWKMLQDAARATHLSKSTWLFTVSILVSMKEW